ncbi:MULTISPECIES: alpha/beta hydrolase [Sphingobacterium]|uniref:Alpha/beta hydrolase n=1 Tax=Sphingobacterium populi TaxID=1812824 RepID=A0ABW5UAK2_9SPHI|nr:alpha/beta hydrolase [Sphingobacterium sp. CFCC 11742]
MIKQVTTLFATIFWLSTVGVLAQSAELAKQNVAYYGTSQDAYTNQQSLLDVYIPEGESDFATIVWFHGGGLTGGQKEIPEYLKGKGMAVVGVGYRFSPQVKVEEIIQDAAQSVRWVFDEIENMGGSKSKIVLSGHSAGGYLAIMLALNKNYLQQHAIDADHLLGVVPFSCQAITHFTARQEQGIEINQPTIDQHAPLFWVRNEVPPVTLITGDRDLEMVGRYEENAYLARMLKIVGNTNIQLLELDGYDHGMVYPALPILVKQVREWLKSS